MLGMPIKVAATEEGSALGAAMCAATAAGHYATVEQAQAAMGAGFKATYEPDPERRRATLTATAATASLRRRSSPPPGGAADATAPRGVRLRRL